MADQERLQISEIHFDKFPTLSTFSCWKIRFKTRVCSCFGFPSEEMLWIKEVEMVESVDDLKSSRSIQGYTHFADISWQSAHIFQTPQFQIVECACRDDATQAQHRVGAILPGHRRAHWWVPAWTPTVHQCPHSVKAVGGSTAHTSTWHHSTQWTRMSTKQIHEVTNTDSVIRAHGCGACYDYTAQQVWSMDSRAESVDAKDIESPRNRDTANEELSTMTEYLTKLNDMCTVETELDDTRYPEHCAQPWTGESWMECRLHWWKAQN